MFRSLQSTPLDHLHIFSSNFPWHGLEGYLVQCGCHGGIYHLNVVQKVSFEAVLILGGYGSVAKLCFTRNSRTRKMV